MTLRIRELRTLDKDLERLSAAERAGVQSLRPLVRIGVAVLFVAIMVVAASAVASGFGSGLASDQRAAVATIAAGVALAAYLALTIGANDVSNALSPAVGSGAIGLRAGLALPYACKGGVCCTCRAKVLEGEVRMEKNYTLEEHEVKDGFVLTCQCHPISDKVVVSYDER